MRIIRWLSAVALSTGISAACFADVSGKVTLTGKIPEMPEIKAMKMVPGCAHKDPMFEETVVAGDKGELANVVVYINPPEGKKLTGGNSKPAVLDQKGCMYVPHVVAMQVGQSLLVKNSDAFLHNVHTLALDNAATNFGMPTVDEAGKKVGPYNTAENIKVKCDVHPWMTAWIVVVDSPFYAVTGEDGTYKIDTKGLADGDYELVFWQEKYGKKSQKISVKGGKAEANAAYDSGQKAQAPAATDVKLASLVQKSGEKCDDGSCCDEPAKTTTATTIAVVNKK
jgi:hypothetical protein